MCGKQVQRGSHACLWARQISYFTLYRHEPFNCRTPVAQDSEGPCVSPLWRSSTTTVVVKTSEWRRSCSRCVYNLMKCLWYHFISIWRPFLLLILTCINLNCVIISWKTAASDGLVSWPSRGHWSEEALHIRRWVWLVSLITELTLRSWHVQQPREMRIDDSHSGFTWSSNMYQNS